MSILLTNIQRFSLHDGPGIRTTVFLKGCSLRCPWCSNPENLTQFPQAFIKDGVSGIYGKYYETDELVKECLKDKSFYRGIINDPMMWTITDEADVEKLPGGVTFSGGEALLQAEALVPAISSLHDEEIHVTVETSLFVPGRLLKQVIDLIDLFYVDIKILAYDVCKNVEQGNIDLYLTNLNTLLTWTDKEGKCKPVIIRIPVIGKYTDGKDNRRAVHTLLEQYKGKFLKIELIKEHNLAESKYRSLNMEASFTGVADDLMEQYKIELGDLGVPVEICKI